MRRSPIPDALYKKIVDAVALPCVDLVIVSGKRFLLGKRANKPARGQWFLIGGRIFKGEHLKEAVRRHVAFEVGVRNLKIVRQLGAQETIFKNSRWGPAAHTVNTVYLVRVPYHAYAPVSSENTELKWFTRIDPRWHPYVKEMLRLAGFR